jgi:adenylate cyclase
VAAEPDNGSAIAHLVNALAVLNEPERAKAWAERAMLLDPENFDMHYNIACAFITSLHDHEAALDLLRPGFERGVAEAINWMKFDPDLDAIRDHPRFVTMMAEAEAKLARGKSDA